MLYDYSLFKLSFSNSIQGLLPTHIYPGSLYICAFYIEAFLIQLINRCEP